MKRTLIIVVLLIASTSICTAQWVVDTIANVPEISKQEVDFISEIPQIDGVLDKNLESLPVRQFSLIARIKTDVAVPITYRIAYGTEFLYVYVKAKSEHLTYRDRAYQNGDGFLVLIGKPQPDNQPTDEFYELACSAVNLPSREWQRRIYWNYNVDKIFVPTGINTKLEYQEGNGIISFELILPWTDVRPYHPWISDGIGFNLTFCKAVEPKGSMWYQVNNDDNSGAEFKKRSYVPLNFQKPELKGNPQTFVSIKEGHITEGQSANAVAVTVSDKSFTENLLFLTGTSESFYGLSTKTYDCKPGITRYEFPVNTDQLIEGSYMFCWKSQNKLSLATTGLSVLPVFDDKELNERLNNVKEKISKGSFSTIQFMIEELKGRLETLKSYETCAKDRVNMTKLIRMVNMADRGIDPLIENLGFIRKAYRSKIDNSLQPYMVYLPDNYDKQKTYPLMVFLHGSASDETNIGGFSSLIPPGFIAVGPFGRGKSNAFSRDHAQDDIAEAIEAVGEDYSIDQNRILLAGFSMGGYGVYRTYYETPKKYKALAIFSGGPNIGARYASKELAPDFTDEKNLNTFSKIPVFIFHGENDLNVSLQTTRDVAAKLKNAGAKVELQIEPNKGHERPGKDSIDAYLKWVEKVME